MVTDEGPVDVATVPFGFNMPIGYEVNASDYPDYCSRTERAVFWGSPGRFVALDESAVPEAEKLAEELVAESTATSPSSAADLRIAERELGHPVATEGLPGLSA
jgi:hypothetical protein